MDLFYRCRARQYDTSPRPRECGGKRELLYRSAPSLGHGADLRNARREHIGLVSIVVSESAIGQ